MHPELVLMLLADARLPVAGHTQSGTVEAALANGLTAADVPAYVRTRLRSVTLVEAGTAVVARHAALAGRGVAEVDVAWAARTPSAALRQASRGQGRALCHLVGRLWPDALPPADILPTPSRATALGSLAAIARSAVAGAPRGVRRRADRVRGGAHFAPVDPAVTTMWVAEALPDVAALADQVADLTAPDQIPAVGCPQIEVWAEAHAVTSRRLFRA